MSGRRACPLLSEGNPSASSAFRARVTWGLGSTQEPGENRLGPAVLF